MKRLFGLILTIAFLFSVSGYANNSGNDVNVEDVVMADQSAVSNPEIVFEFICFEYASVMTGASIVYQGSKEGEPEKGFKSEVYVPPV